MITESNLYVRRLTCGWVHALALPLLMGASLLQAAESLNLNQAAVGFNTTQLMNATPGAAAELPPLEPPELEPARMPAPDNGASRVMSQGLASEPFGARLFDGGFGGTREDGLNPGYVLQPGDSVTVRIWGATQYHQNLVIDQQGNVFLPNVGPIHLAGVRNAQLNDRVAAAVARVYTDNVRVYTSLNSAQPVTVYVTGFVSRPGRFHGIPSDSLLYFLDQAGGVDQIRGSYRDVRVLRNGIELVEVDLYRFLLQGSLPDLQFQDGDTVVVGKRGSTVAVSGDAANQAVFEFPGASLSGADLMAMALLQPGVSHVGLTGLRNGQPWSAYMTLEEFRQLKVVDGDTVVFRIDRHDRMIIVDVEGSFSGPSRFTVPSNTRLKELLDYIPIDPELSNPASISIRRLEIAERQRAALNESLRRLESRYLTANSQTDAEASIRTQEAELIAQFVQNAREVEPDGRLVVANNGNIADVLLKSGDTITIPSRSESVLLSGEVMVAQAMLYQKGHDAMDYIERSGGFGEQADRSRIVVVHSNGEVATGRRPEVRPGDEIIVLPKVPVKNLQLAATIVDILYKVAVAASVAVNL